MRNSIIMHFRALQCVNNNFQFSLTSLINFAHYDRTIANGNEKKHFNEVFCIFL